jgi:Ca-activated chloride channel family protein
VKEYRLIGFDNKLKALSDSLNELQGGEVGSGHSLLALFELTPVNPDSARRNGEKDLLAKVELNYKLPHDSVNRTTYFNCPYRKTPFQHLQPCYRFASSIALFGGLLKRSVYTRQAGWKDAFRLAEQSYDPEDGMQTEFITLIEKARRIYKHEKHRKKQE